MIHRRLSFTVVGLAPLLLASSAMAQAPVTVPGTEQYQMKSSTNGVEYLVDVALPAGYATSGKRYPVFYALDANLEFGQVVDVYRELRITAGVPEMIIVGIGYPEGDPAIYTPAYHASRSRDYTPSNDEASLPGSGKAPEFLRFIKTELIPLIDGRYRTDPTDRALGGHSLGGLFTTYTLLNEPTLFRRYWIGSPSLWWKKLEIFGTVAAAKARADQPKGRVFLTVGALETDIMVPPMVRMAATLKATFPTLEVGSMVYPDETHMSVIPGAIGRAIGFLYARPTVPILPADAAAYSGRWKSATGEVLSLVVRAGKLMLTTTTYGAGMTVEVLAASRDNLFNRVTGMEIAAERDQAGKVVRLRRRPGPTAPEMVFERAK